MAADDRASAGELASDADLLRLRSLRRRAEEAGERRRARCARCRKAIPPGKRADARFCSYECQNRSTSERRYELLREIKQAVRDAKAPAACPCGAALDVSFRAGPVPTTCQKCYQREYCRAKRARERG